MSFLNGKIAKVAVFTIPINNAPDEKITDIISGNSLQEIENIAEQMRNDYAEKNADIKDPNKPVRLEIQDANGKSYLEHIRGKWRFLTRKVKEALEDENDEEGSPKDSQQ